MKLDFTGKSLSQSSNICAQLRFCRLMCGPIWPGLAKDVWHNQFNVFGDGH